MTDITSISILFIVSDDGLGQTLVEYAEMLGWNVHCTPNHSQALQTAMRQRFDVIIIGSEDGDGDGMQPARAGNLRSNSQVLVDQLRSGDGPNQRAPLLVTSHSSSSETLIRIVQSGFDGCLPTPFGLNGLRDAVLEAIDEHAFISKSSRVTHNPTASSDEKLTDQGQPKQKAD
ncbi:MAG: hypothetical protein AAF556_04390 [Pseudomonadota bacterium]